MNELFDPVGDDCYDVEPPTIPATSEIDALQDAGWHLRQIRHLRRRLAEVNAVRDREIDRIDAWHREEAIRLDGRIGWHEAPLRQLSERLYEADPRRKSVRLPDGEMKLRTYTKPQAVIDDADALLDWAKENAPMVLRQRVSVSDLRRETVAHADGKVVLTATGEVVPHATAVVPDPTWSCSTDLEESPA